MSKLYKVKLASGFNAAGRTRAGVVLEKGVTSIVELNKEQLAALEADNWIEVSEAPEGATVTGPGESVVENNDEEEVVTDPYEGVSFKDLKAQATEKGLDIKGLKSRDAVIAVLEAAKSEESEDEEDDEEEVELSEDMTLEQLKQIAETQGVEDLDTYGEEDKAKLIEAIEASANTEE